MWINRTPYADQSELRPTPPQPVTTAFYGNGTALPQSAYPGLSWLRPLLHLNGGGEYRPTLYSNAPTGPAGLPFNPGG